MPATVLTVPDVLVATDSTGLVADVEAAIGGRGTTVRAVSRGVDVVPAIRSAVPDLVVLDMQIGNMGGIATCLDLRLEESGGRLAHVPVLVLLDRRADVFLVRRAQAEGWLVKPLDPIRIRRATLALLDGRVWEDATDVPEGRRPAPRSDLVG